VQLGRYEFKLLVCVFNVMLLIVKSKQEGVQTEQNFSI